MALPSYPNAISLGAIRSEYGRSGAISLGDLRIKDSGPVYPGAYGYPNGSYAAIPTSGTISLSRFHGNTAYTPTARTVNISAAGAGSWTVPSTVIGNLTVTTFGGGGGGAIWPSGSAGGAGGGGARFVGSIPIGTTINYNVAYGGPSNFGDSSRYARDPGYTQFGTSGQAWYMYIPGTGVGGYNMSGGNRGPGVGSTAQGTSGVSIGVGGNGAAERGGTPGNASNYGGGGGTYSGAGNYGNGAGGGGRGGASRENGTWPAGGGGGFNGNYPGVGATGAVIITGTW
jgi:hypothetical protein